MTSAREGACERRGITSRVMVASRPKISFWLDGSISTLYYGCLLVRLKIHLRIFLCSTSALSKLFSTWATIDTRLQMVCTFIDTPCKYTTYIMRSLMRSSLMLLVGGCDGRATVVEVGWRRCCLETAGSELALHWGSLSEACCLVKSDEVGELIRLSSS
jgi:hypothetical protein